MHVEVPKSKFSSFKEFAGEYAMIVVSIGTALALEHGVQSWHHKHEAELAAGRMESELRANLAEIEKVGKHNSEQGKRLNMLSEALLKDLQAKVPDQVAIQHFNAQNKDDFGINLHTATLSRDAWDVAVANQSASWLDAATLQRYSSAYAAIRDAQAFSNTGFIFMNGPDMMRTMSDLQMGTITARNLYYSMRQMLASYAITNQNLRTLKAELNKALDKKALS